MITYGKYREAVDLAKDLESSWRGNAELYLMQSGYTPAEAAEITGGVLYAGTQRLTHDWRRIYEQIRSTVACSVRIGDRLQDDLLPELDC